MSSSLSVSEPLSGSSTLDWDELAGLDRIVTAYAIGDHSVVLETTEGREIRITAWHDRAAGEYVSECDRRPQRRRRNHRRAGDSHYRLVRPGPQQVCERVRTSKRRQERRARLSRLGANAGLQALHSRRRSELPGSRRSRGRPRQHLLTPDRKDSRGPSAAWSIHLDSVSFAVPDQRTAERRVG